jgi:hypothetical protein
MVCQVHLGVSFFLLLARYLRIYVSYDLITFTHYQLSS